MNDVGKVNLEENRSLFLSTWRPGNVNKVTTSERIFHGNPFVMAWCLKLNRQNLCDLTRLASLLNIEAHIEKSTAKIAWCNV